MEMHVKQSYDQYIVLLNQQEATNYQKENTRKSYT